MSLVFLTLEDENLEQSRQQYMCLEADEATVAVVKRKLAKRYGLGNSTQGIIIYRRENELDDGMEVKDGETLTFFFEDCADVLVRNLQNDGEFLTRFPSQSQVRQRVLATHFCACLEENITEEGKNEFTFTPSGATKVKIYCGSRTLDCPFPEMNVQKMRSFAAEMLAWEPFLIAFGRSKEELLLVSAKKDVRFDLPSGQIDRTIRLETEWTAEDLCTWGSNELGLPSDELLLFHGQDELGPKESIATLQTSETRKLILRQTEPFSVLLPHRRGPVIYNFLPSDLVCNVQKWICQDYRRRDCILKSENGDVCKGDCEIGRLFQSANDRIYVTWTDRWTKITSVTRKHAVGYFLLNETVRDIKQYCMIEGLSDETPESLVLFSWKEMYSDDVCVANLRDPCLFVVPRDWKVSCDVECGNNKHIPHEGLCLDTTFLDLVKKVEKEEHNPCDLCEKLPNGTVKYFDPAQLVASAVLEGSSHFHVCSPMRLYKFAFGHESGDIVFDIEFDYRLKLRDVKSELTKFFSIPDGWELKKKDGSAFQQVDKRLFDIHDEVHDGFRVCYQGEAKLRLPLEKSGVNLSIPLPLSSKVQDLISQIDKNASVTFTRQSQQIFADTKAFLYDTVITSDPIEVSVNRQELARGKFTIPVYRTQRPQTPSQILEEPPSPKDKVSVPQEITQYTIIEEDGLCHEGWEFPADATVQDVIRRVEDVLKLRNFHLCDFESGDKYDPTTPLTKLQSKEILIRQNESKPETPLPPANSEPEPQTTPKILESMEAAQEDDDSLYKGRKITYTFVLDDNEFSLDVPEDAPISWVREKIAERMKQDYDRIQVFFASRALADDILLSKARMPPGYKIPVLLRDISEILIRTARRFRTIQEDEDDAL